MVTIFFRRLSGLFLLGLVFLVLFTYLGAAWLNQQIFSPPRKPLHSFHLERLNNPARFGLRVRSYGCWEGKAPCLLVEPDAEAGAGKRGRILQQQLRAKGVEVPAYGTVYGTLVLLHGRNGRKESLLAVAERFVAAGFRCLLLDLPAHGDSPLETLNFGSTGAEQQLARQALVSAREHFQLPEEPAALWGLSMGGAFAVAAAREAPGFWDSVVVVSSFASLDEVLGYYIPPAYASWKSGLLWTLDIQRRLAGQAGIRSIQPKKWAGEVSTPVLVVHGDRDRYVPMAQGQALFSALNSPERDWLVVPGGGHRNVLTTPMQLYAALSAWLLDKTHQPR